METSRSKNSTPRFASVWRTRWHWPAVRRTALTEVTYSTTTLVHPSEAPLRFESGPARKESDPPLRLDTGAPLRAERGVAPRLSGSAAPRTRGVGGGECLERARTSVTVASTVEPNASTVDATRGPASASKRSPSSPYAEEDSESYEDEDSESASSREDSASFSPRRRPLSVSSGTAGRGDTVASAEPRSVSRFSRFSRSPSASSSSVSDTVASAEPSVDAEIPADVAVRGGSVPGASSSPSPSPSLAAESYSEPDASESDTGPMSTTLSESSKSYASARVCSGVPGTGVGASSEAFAAGGGAIAAGAIAAGAVAGAIAGASSVTSSVASSVTSSFTSSVTSSIVSPVASSVEPDRCASSPSSSSADDASVSYSSESSSSSSSPSPESENVSSSDGSSESTRLTSCSRAAAASASALATRSALKPGSAALSSLPSSALATAASMSSTSAWSIRPRSGTSAPRTRCAAPFASSLGLDGASRASSADLGSTVTFACRKEPKPLPLPAPDAAAGGVSRGTSTISPDDSTSDFAVCTGATPKVRADRAETEGPSVSGFGAERHAPIAAPRSARARKVLAHTRATTSASRGFFSFSTTCRWQPERPKHTRDKSRRLGENRRPRVARRDRS